MFFFLVWLEVTRCCLLFSMCACVMCFDFSSLWGGYRDSGLCCPGITLQMKSPQPSSFGPLSLFWTWGAWCHISEAYFNGMLCCEGMELASWMAFITPQGCSSPHCSWRINLHGTHQCIQSAEMVLFVQCLLVLCLCIGWTIHLWTILQNTGVFFCFVFFSCYSEYVGVNSKH